MADFETKCEQHALDYIKIHLREGYYVTAYVDKGEYYWEKVYKVHVYKVNNTPQTETKEIRYCNECKWFKDSQVCGRCRSRNLFAEADTSQTEKGIVNE